MRILFIIAFCGMLSATICQSITPDLYDAAVMYAQNMKTLVDALPATTDTSARPDAIKAEEALEIIKSMKAKCENTIDHQDPEFSGIRDALARVISNDLILQQTGPFTEPGLIKAREGAIAASNKLMALLVEIPTPTAALAKPATKSGGSDEDSDDEDNEDEDEEDNDGDDEDDSDEDDNESDEEDE